MWSHLAEQFQLKVCLVLWKYPVHCEFVSNPPPSSHKHLPISRSQIVQEEFSRLARFSADTLGILGHYMVSISYRESYLLGIQMGVFLRMYDGYNYMYVVGTQGRLGFIQSG